MASGTRLKAFMQSTLWPDLETQSQALLDTIPLKTQQKLQDTLSDRYRCGLNKEIQSKEEAILYLITRLPATLRVGEEVLKILRQVSPSSTAFKHILDCGAGPGGTRFLFPHFFNDLHTLTLVEKNSFMHSLGKILNHPMGTFVNHDYRKFSSLSSSLISSYELAYLSYTLSECISESLPSILNSLWEKITWGLIIIEPGTPQGFKTIQTARTHLIQQGAYILAPCGHEGVCPLVPPDWCHFSCRVFRTKAHQRLKKGTQPFEDEKFSYLIASKQPSTASLSPRLIRPPLKRKGHTLIDLCTKKGVERLTLTPSKNPLYKAYQQLEWGDAFSSPPSSGNQE